MKNALTSLLLLLALALPACSEAPSTTATTTGTLVGASPTPSSSSPTPSATPLPEITFPSLSLLPGRQPGDWRVVGLIENHSALSLINAHVAVRLLDSSGSPLSETDVPITFTHLGPNEVSPFRADFPAAGLAAEAQAELSSYQIGSFQRHELLLDVLSTTSTDRGGLAILATISNPGDAPASIAALTVLAQNDQGRAVGLAGQMAGPAVLRGGESASVLALLEIDAVITSFVPYVDAVTAELMPDPQPVGISGETTLVLDSQGNPFIVGMLQNSSQQSWMASATLTLSYRGERISAAQVTTPVPLGPGEIRPFTATDFPGLHTRLAGETWSLQDLTFEARLDPLILGSETSPYSHLDLSIRSFEAIGGFAFLQGVVTNPYAEAVQNASVMAALYTTRGRLVTAGWMTVAQLLPAGASVDFVLPIPMPADANPRLSEFDAWAGGVRIAAPAVDPD